MRASTFTISALLAAMVLSGCASVGPDYQRPAMETTVMWKTAGQQQTDFANWWKQFQDPVLDQLIAEAISSNQDLVAATGRMEEARALAVGARANRFPSVDATAGASRSKASETTGRLAAGADPRSKDFQLGLTASYEVDIWGKLSRADEAAKARYLASEANRNTVRTSVLSSVVQTYFSLRAADEQVQLAQDTLKSRQTVLALQQKRRAAGAIGDADLHLAESEAAGAEVTLAQAKQNQAGLESALAVLLGRTPAAVAQPQIARGKPVQALYSLAGLPADLPSDVLQRRPDLIAAEQNLIAANADIGQAKAQYFPSLRLTASTGYESNVLENLTKPGSLLWNLAGNLVQPVFRAGAIDAVVAGAEARKTTATAQYVQAVQGAFRDVHDALSAVSTNDQVYQASLKRVDALRDSQRIIQRRYEQGYSSYSEVLNAQRDLAQVQTALIEAQRAHLAAVVSLYKAVGGGWDVSAPRA
ncbi:efflux transporter outer membrane subunit [Undibacterium squillarum]|uniref:RND transporter n=1 Tax=Undibacterium squillarum TaxID=1131567 RepID=A0ABQ2XU16_9BURK|nr:efflux transporter outer membrane subunit [Undibacterium squillarum]GGX33098.1 RND transporter [Undibacterium squillarum]